MGGAYCITALASVQIGLSLLIYSQKSFTLRWSLNHFSRNNQCKFDPKKLNPINWLVGQYFAIPMRTLALLSISISSLVHGKEGLPAYTGGNSLREKHSGWGQRETYWLCVLAAFGAKYWRNVRHGSKILTRQDLCKHLNQTKLIHFWGSQKRDN